MECLPDHESMCYWLIHYGPWALFILLALGIIALPVPEETLLVITGTLISRNKIGLSEGVAAAILGSMTGITMSYFLGRFAGNWIFNRFGSFWGLKEGEPTKAHYWFEKYGKGALFIGYFIPGVRHFTGLIAGATNLDYKSFALWAYSGAIVWIATFLSLGYFFGDWGLTFFDSLELKDQRLLLFSTAVLAIAGIYAYFKYTKKKPGI